MLFDGEESLRADEARLIELAAFTVAFIQWDGERIPVRAAGDLAENQIRARKIGNHQCRPPFFGGRVLAAKWNYNNFARYRFDHRYPLPESPIAADNRFTQLGAVEGGNFLGTVEAPALSFCSRTLITNNCMFYHEEHRGDRVIL